MIIDENITVARLFLCVLPRFYIIGWKFFDNIYRAAKRHSENSKSKLTLKEIAKDAAVTHGKENARKIPASTLKRQAEVIEHFEKKVKELGIKDFMWDQIVKDFIRKCQ